MYMEGNALYDIEEIRRRPAALANRQDEDDEEFQV